MGRKVRGEMMRLQVVREGARKQDDEALRARAAELFPSSTRLQDAWVRARMYIGSRKPRVDVGGAHCDLTRFPRTLREAGIHALDEVIEVPRFLARWVK